MVILKKYLLACASILYFNEWTETRASEMTQNIEVEKKFEIIDLQSINNVISKNQFIKQKRDIDIYYDTAEGNLFCKGIFLRIRNGKTLDFKFNIEDFLENNILNYDHTSCNEYSFDLPLHNQHKEKINEVLGLLRLKTLEEVSLENFLESNSFVEFVTIDKVRKTYTDDVGFTLCIDEVTDLGFFFEIEKLVSHSSEVAEVLEEIDKRYGMFIENKNLNVGYVELFLRKHNFDLYKKGKYILPSDL